MDGGSTDGSIDILRNTHGTVRWRSEGDNGQSHALNKALDASKGDIVGWLNSDDAYYRRDAVELAVQTFKKYPNADVVYGHAALVNADGLILHMVWVPRFDANLLRIHNYIIQPATFIRRRAIIERFVDEGLLSAMDRELWLHLARTRPFVRINRVLAIDRHHRDRKSVAQQELGRLDSARIASDYQIPFGLSERVRLKAAKTAFRLAGASLTREATQKRACNSYLDSYQSLCIRQLLIARAAMPAGSVTAQIHERPNTN